MELRKKGLLLKKEYRGSFGLNLNLQSVERSIRNEDIRKLAKEMKAYLRRLKHLSIDLRDLSFLLLGNFDINITPLLRSIKHNFVGLVTLKLSLKRRFELGWKCLDGFERLFGKLRPTLKHLDLDFTKSKNVELYFPESLGQIIMKNLHRLETLCLNFGDTKFPLDIVMFFFNKACSHMPNLKKLNLQMTNCVVDNQWYLPQTSLKNNLRSLVLNFDYCENLSIEYLLFLQKDITSACPLLEDLSLCLPNYKRFSGRFLSALRFLQKLNLKRIEIKLSDELEKTWDNYQDFKAIERANKVRLIESACKIRQKVEGEEEFRLYYETMIEDEKLPDGHFFECDAQDDLLNQMNQEQEEKEQNEIDEQDGAEYILRGGLTYEEQLIVHDIGLFGFFDMDDWDEEEVESEVLIMGLGEGFEEEEEDWHEEEIDDE